MPTQSTLTSTTQRFLDIFDITNDLLVMKDGATSLIITVSAMNFGLLAEEEQDAIMYAYAGLLNSLNYPIQIVIRSQTKDATKYLNLLKDQQEIASSELKRRAIEHYRTFVSNLIRERNVLDKKFYVVIPASALEMGLLPPQTVVPGVKSIDISTVERSVILEKARNILEPKRDHLIAQFNRIGLFARQLNTQEIIQLFYTSYNPEAAEGQQLTDTANYTTTLISTQGGVAPMNVNATPSPAPANPAPTMSPTSAPTMPPAMTPPAMDPMPMTPPAASTPAAAPSSAPMSTPSPMDNPMASPTSPGENGGEPLAMPTPAAAAPQPTTTVFSAPTTPAPTAPAMTIDSMPSATPPAPTTPPAAVKDEALPQLPEI